MTEKSTRSPFSDAHYAAVSNSIDRLTGLLHEPQSQDDRVKIVENITRLVGMLTTVTVECTGDEVTR